MKWLKKQKQQNMKTTNEFSAEIFLQKFLLNSTGFICFFLESEQDIFSLPISMLFFKLLFCAESAKSMKIMGNIYFGVARYILYTCFCLLVCSLVQNKCWIKSFGKIHLKSFNWTWVYFSFVRKTFAFIVVFLAASW